MAPKAKLWFALFCLFALFAAAGGGAVLAIVLLAFAFFVILTNRVYKPDVYQAAPPVVSSPSSPLGDPRGMATFDQAAEWMDGFLCGFAARLNLDGLLLPSHQQAVLRSNREAAKAFGLAYHSAHPEAVAEEAALQYTKLVFGDVAGIGDRRALIAIPKDELGSAETADPSQSDSEVVLAAAHNSASDSGLLGASLDPREYHAAIPLCLAVTFEGGHDAPADRLATYIRRELSATRDIDIEVASDEQDLRLSLVAVSREQVYAASMLLTLRLDRLSPEVVILDQVVIAAPDLGEIAAAVVGRLKEAAFKALRRTESEGASPDQV